VRHQTKVIPLNAALNGAELNPQFLFFALSRVPAHRAAVIPPLGNSFLGNALFWNERLSWRCRASLNPSLPRPQGWHSSPPCTFHWPEFTPIDSAHSNKAMNTIWTSSDGWVSGNCPGDHLELWYGTPTFFIISLPSIPHTHRSKSKLAWTARPIWTSSIALHPHGFPSFGRNSFPGLPSSLFSTYTPSFPGSRATATTRSFLHKFNHICSAQPCHHLVAVQATSSQLFKFPSSPFVALASVDFHR
jgi:hypothetical protein